MILRHYMLDLPPQEVNIWLLGSETAGTALMVDAGAWEPRIREALQAHGLRLTHLLLTHLHWDHVDGLSDYLREFPELEVIAPAVPPSPAPCLRIVGEGDRVTAGGFEFVVYKTSGHTPESISYHCAGARLCFVGDAIFAGAVGGTKDDALHEEQLGHLRRTVLRLPPETELLSGHGPLTTVGIELAANPFLQPGFTRTAPTG